MDPHHQSIRLWKNHRKGWVTILGLLWVATSLVSQNADNLKLSLLTIPEQAPFDGTSLPLKEVPNWLTLKQDNDDIIFNDLTTDQLIPLPLYDPSRLDNDDATRQIKLTYSVVYAGTYRGDGIEGIGSHPAVDIRAPQGTPVYAIANGIVERVTYSDYGFGNLIVLRHDDVPTESAPTIKTTLHSGYAHLSTIAVAEGQVVTKGQRIGEVGATGTATTNHLHFQIDNDSAPWHLYWPFTSAEANEAGGFFEAINQGVGQANVYSYTVNPMTYVQEYLSYTEFAKENTTPEPAVTSEITEPPLADEPSSSVYVPPFASIDVDYQKMMLTNTHQLLTVTLLDAEGNNVTNPNYNAPIKIAVTDPTILNVFPFELPRYKFVTGPTQIDIIGLKEGQTDLSFTFLDNEFARISITVTADPGKIGEEPPIQDETTVVTFSDLNENDLYYDAIETLQKRHIIQGYPDGTFQPTQMVSRVEALKVILEIAEINVLADATLSFRDTQNDQWYAPYIATAQTLDIVQGYPDETFQPTKEVNRVEFIKMLTKALKIDVDPVVITNPFDDTNRLEWYAPYAQFIKQTNLSPWDQQLEPSTPMNRGEVAEMLYRVLVLKEKICPYIRRD